MLKMKFLAGVALALGLSSNASAAITVFTDQASFLAAISAPATDTFQGLSIVGVTDSPITRSAGAYGYRAAVSTTSFFGAGTSANPWLSTNTATDTIAFSNFTGGVYGLGGNFFGSDLGGAFASGGVILTATDAGLIRGAAAEAVAACDRAAHRAVVALRAAYDAGNARSYTEAAQIARKAVADLLAAQSGECLA